MRLFDFLAPATSARYIAYWHRMNAARAKKGKALLPKKCCRNPNNFGPPEASGPDTTFQRCMVCKCRHFTAILDPGKFETALSNAKTG